MDRAVKNLISKKHIVLACIALLVLALFVFSREARILLVCSLFIALGALSTLYKRFIPITFIHFELVKLGTILTSVAYGAPAGIIVGLVGGLSGKVLSGRINPDLIGTIIATIIIATLAATLREIPIAILGIGLTLLYHAISFCFAIALGENPATMVAKLASNTVFNVFVFLTIAGPLLSLLR